MKNKRIMIRIRLTRSIRSIDLIEQGFEKIQSEHREYYRKYIGPYEIQIKLSFPTNVRVQNWDDSRAPWILFKFLLALEAKEDISGKIKVVDLDGKYKILPVEDTLELIKDLSRYTDLANRLSYWYKEYLKGNLKTL